MMTESPAPGGTMEEGGEMATSPEPGEPSGEMPGGEMSVSPAPEGGMMEKGGEMMEKGEGMMEKGEGMMKEGGEMMEEGEPEGEMPGGQIKTSPAP